MATQGLRQLTALAIVLAVLAGGTGTAQAAPAAVCAKAGATTALAVKLLGAGAHATAGHSINETTCILTPKDASHRAGISVDLEAASNFSDGVEADMYQGTGESLPIAGLGTGAVLLVFKTGYVGVHIWFKTGKYTVKVLSEAPQDDTKLLKATETNAIAVARAIHAHLAGRVPVA